MSKTKEAIEMLKEGDYSGRYGFTTSLYDTLVTMDPEAPEEETEELTGMLVRIMTKEIEEKAKEMVKNLIQSY